MKKEDCVFCQIVNGKIPANFIYKGKNLVAFYNINPIAPKHILVIPKKHIENLTSAKAGDKALLGEIQLVAADLAKKLKIDKGFRILMANGKAGGQTVFHLHYHLVGGWKKAPKEDIIN